MEDGEDGLSISSPHVESLFVDEYPWVVTISRKLRDENGEERQIAMDIRFSNIAQYVDEVGIGQHGYCFIMDGNGNIVYHPQQQLLYSGLKSEDTETLKDYPDGANVLSDAIYTIHTMENCDWKIVGVCYVDEMVTGKVKSMIRIVLLILAAVLFAALLSGLIFSELISRPANRLARAMEEFERKTEDFNFEAVHGTSEIMALSDSFGHMVVKIQELMEKVRQEEIFLRKTELNALQAQINPHFLYNTLDSIAWMCEEERTKEAVEMVNALAKLFRISISRGHELIPLKDELKHAESYLKIQKYRYGNRFTYQFDVDEACLPYLCNKITLQPMIENALYHGFDMVDEGEIIISAHFKGEDILLAVEDNGVGMTEEQCRDILQREAGDRTGIGIKNVHERIRIYFGERYGLHIISELDEGTRVEILIPKVSEGEYDAK
jgi:two-component system sensor histidine kinase YesM